MTRSERPAQLALYTMPGCPFCDRVLESMARLGLDMELRDVTADRSRRSELMQARGRGTVPVLWIQSADGSVRWMPESLDIVRYLEQMYGLGK